MKRGRREFEFVDGAIGVRRVTDRWRRMGTDTGRLRMVKIESRAILSYWRWTSVDERTDRIFSYPVKLKGIYR